jgi:uncharacterized beta-barrel protein YwiB (DUF1934 family)
LKKDVVLTITGSQMIDGQKEQVELTTTGTYYRKGEQFYITYDESSATGYSGSKTTVTVTKDGQRVTMLRSDPYKSHLVIEKGQRHQCAYTTEAGPLYLGIIGQKIHSDLKEEAGELSFQYSLDINASLISVNEVSIQIKECHKPC